MLKHVAATTIGLVALVTLVSLSACSKSVEGETKSWEQNRSSIAHVAALYPAFKAPLDEQQAAAEKTWAAAAEAASEEARIEKMAAANAMLDAGFVGILRGLERRTTKLRSRLVEVGGATLDESDRLSAKAALDDANRVLTNIDATIRAGAPSVVAAEAVLGKVDRDIRSVEDNLQKVQSLTKKKQAAMDEAAAQAKTPPSAPVAQWKCDYCGSMNDGKLDKCNSCGAAHKH